MLEAEKGEEDVTLALDRLVARTEAGGSSGRAGGGGEREGLADCEVRQVVVVLQVAQRSIGVNSSAHKELEP